LLAIGSWYQNFAQVPDAEVCALLARMRHSLPDASGEDE
jgi:predicted phosphoribosyltransferase